MYTNRFLDHIVIQYNSMYLATLRPEARENNDATVYALCANCLMSILKNIMFLHRWEDFS